MRPLIAVRFLAAVALFGCSRSRGPTPEERHPVRAEPPSTPRSAAADAAPPASAPPATTLPDLVLESPTCAEDGLIERMMPAFESGTRIVCRSGDAGVAFEVPPHANRRHRVGMAMALVVSRQIANMDERGRRRELQGMDRESRTDPERYASIGLVFRNPDRTRGRIVIFEGLAAEVQERNGVTFLRMVTDIAARERVEVVLPAIAPDDVVRGARVRVYGFHVDTEQERSALHGDLAKPVVYAVALVALGGGS